MPVPIAEFQRLAGLQQQRRKAMMTAQVFHMSLSGLDFTACDPCDKLSIAGPMVGLRSILFPKEADLEIIRKNDPLTISLALTIDSLDEIAATIGTAVVKWKGQRSGSLYITRDDVELQAVRIGSRRGKLAVQVRENGTQINVMGAVPVDQVPQDWVERLAVHLGLSKDAWVSHLNTTYSGYPMSLFAFPFNEYAKVQKFLRKRVPELGDTCAKCSHEVKVRPSFNHTFVGCMC